MAKIITSEKCGCYFNSDCLKRTFTFYNEYSNQLIHFQICKDFISLKLKEKSIFCKNNYQFNEELEKIILNELSLHEEIYSNWNHGYCRNFSDIRVNFIFCDRPFILRGLKIQDAIEIYKETKSDKLLKAMIESLSNFMKEKHKYKEPIQKASSIRMIITKIKKTYFDSELTDILFNQLFIELISKQLTKSK